MADFNKIIDNIKKEFGNTDSQLDRAIKEDKLWKLAGLLGSHVLYVGKPGFGLNEADKAELKRIAWIDGDQYATKQALIKWRKKTRSNCFTYKSLIKILNSLAKDQCKGQIATGFKCSLYWMLACTVVLIGILSIVVLRPYYYREGFIPSAEQSSKTAGTTVGNALSLPPQPEIFVGREDDMQDLLSKLNFKSNETGIIGIVGSPGFGKSTLANELGHRLAYQGVHVHYVDFGDFMKGDVQLYLAEKILPETEQNPSFNKLLEWAKNITEKTVVIADNCDVMFQVQDAGSTQFTNAIRKLVQISKSIKVVTTSIKPVTVTDFQHTIETFTLNASVLFLDQKLQNRVIKISLKEKEEIANLTGYVPLALDIVGSLLNLRDSSSPETIINDLKQDPILVLNPPKILVHSRINASISLAFKYLDDHVKEVAVFLSLFPGSFDRKASKEISKKLDEANMSNLVIADNDLSILVSLSLLEFNKTGQGRYHYHRLIQEFFKKMEFTNDSSHNFVEKFSEYYLSQLCNHTKQFNHRYVKSLKFLDAERHNIYEILSGEKSSFTKVLAQLTDVLTYAIDEEYITRRFTESEMLDFLNNLKLSFEHQFKPQYQVESNRLIMSQNYVMLLSAITHLLAVTNSSKVALDYVEKIRYTNDYLMAKEVIEKNYEHKNSELTCRSLMHLGIQQSVFQHLIYSAAVDQNFFKNERDFSFWHLLNPASAAKYFKGILEYETGENKIRVLYYLALAYTLDNTTDNVSQELNNTVDHILLEIPKLNRNEKIAIWDLLIQIIKLLSKKVQSDRLYIVEESLFLLISDPIEPFQPEPKLALESMDVFSATNNQTKMILWSSHFLKAFDKSDDIFSPEDMETILHIRHDRAMAYIVLGFLGRETYSEEQIQKFNIQGCKELLYICKAVTRTPEQYYLRSHINISKEACLFTHTCKNHFTQAHWHFIKEYSLQDPMGGTLMHSEKLVESAEHLEFWSDYKSGEDKIRVLYYLFLTYMQIEGLSEHQLKPHLLSKELNNTADRILLGLFKLNKTQVMANLDLIMDCIKVLSNIVQRDKLNNLFEKKLFSLISDPIEPLQSVLTIIDLYKSFNGIKDYMNNHTKTILWGSKFIKVFESSEDIFSPEDIVSTCTYYLFVHFYISKAHLALGRMPGEQKQEHEAEGCEGMKHLCERANTNRNIHPLMLCKLKAPYQKATPVDECPDCFQTLTVCDMSKFACSIYASDCNS